MLLVLENMENSSKFKHELKLEGYPDDDVRSCVAYAIEKNLIEGTFFRPISGAKEPIPQSLTAHGQDFIEHLHSKKREVSAVHNSAANPSNEKPPNATENQNSLNIWQQPIGATWLVVIGGSLVLMVGYIFRHYFGIPL